MDKIKLQAKPNKRIDSDTILLFLYCCTLILGILINSYIPHHGFSTVRNLLFAVMLVIAIFCEKHNYYQYIILIAGLIFNFYGMVNFPKQQIDYLYIVIIFFVMSTVSPKKIVFWSVLVLAACTLVLYLASSMGIITNYLVYRNKSVRQSWGTNYPLTFASYIFFIWAGIVFLEKNLHLKKKLMLTLLIIISSVITTSLTGGRNFGMALILLIPVLFLKNTKDKRIKYLYRGLTLIILLMCSISIYITKIIPYDSNYYPILNDIFSGRLELQDILFNFYSPKLLGQFIPQFTQRVGYYFFIDNSYTRLMYFAGIAFFVYYFFVIIVGLNRWISEGKIKLVTIFLIILITGIIQGTILSVSADIFLPLLCFESSKRVNYEEKIIRS